MQLYLKFFDKFCFTSALNKIIFVTKYWQIFFLDNFTKTTSFLTEVSYFLSWCFQSWLHDFHLMNAVELHFQYLHRCCFVFSFSQYFPFWAFFIVTENSFRHNLTFLSFLVLGDLYISISSFTGVSEYCFFPFFFYLQLLFWDLLLKKA